jgi:LPS-assembly lipoprotein
MNRRTTLAVLAIGVVAGSGLLAGCGFQPVYSPDGRGIGPVQVALIDGRTGYLVQQELTRLATLERGAAPARRLEVVLDSAFASTNQRADGFFNRTQLTVTANWKLLGSREAPDGQGRVSVMVGYDTREQAFGTVSLQADAEERAAVMLAERIWADVAVRAPASAAGAGAGGRR